MVQSNVNAPNDKNRNNNLNEINTRFPVEFPDRSKDTDNNHIEEVVVNEVYPPKSNNSNGNNLNK
ncbi:MAG: hypothetical protein ACI4G1_01930 [Ruminococcus sp.]